MNSKADKELISMFQSDSFEEPYEAIEILLKDQAISDSLFEFILELDDHIVVAEFLERFEYLTSTQLIRFETFVLDNLYNEDKLLVSSLIDAANLNRVLSIYDGCLDLAQDSNNDSNVIMSSLFYICENLYLNKFKSIFGILKDVLSNSEYCQNHQVVAAFYLFRLTSDKKFFNELGSLINSGQKMNQKVLRNILDYEYNGRIYFALYDDVERLLISD